MTLTPPAVQTTHTPVGPVTWVTSRRDVQYLAESLRSCTTCVFDLETTGLDEHAVRGGMTNGGVEARIVLASFTLPQTQDRWEDPTSWVVPLSHPESPWLGRWQELYRAIIKIVHQRQIPVINQNLKYDIRWTTKFTGFDLSGQILWDTQVGSHLMDENESTKLKERAPRVFKVPRWDDHDLSTPAAAERVPLFELGEYAARDTYYAWKLSEYQRRALFAAPDSDPNEAFEQEERQNARLGRLAQRCAMPTVASLTRMEQRGMRLDVEATRDELAKEHDAADRLMAEMVDRYDLPPEVAESGPSMHATSNWFKSWTTAAVKAGDLQIGSMTPNGNPQWDKFVLTRQARLGSEVAQLILDQRGHSKRAEFLQSWLDHLAPDGAVHSSYNVGKVVTGRLSSSDINAQQISKKLRPMFIPRPGYVIADIDYSQIELRVAAHIAGCLPMIEAYRSGDDLHRLLAAQITGKPVEEITPEERQMGKAGNFGLLYLMSVLGFVDYAEAVYDVRFTEEEATQVHEAFFSTWDGIRQWHTKSIARAQRYGYVVSPIGRVRRLPDINSPVPFLKDRAEKQAVNSPVQGFASDLMQMAAASIVGVLPGHRPVQGAHPVATVHDSLVIEVDEDDWAEITDHCMQRMVGLQPELKAMDCDFSVPIEADAVVGTRWGLADVGEMASTL